MPDDVVVEERTTPARVSSRWWRTGWGDIVTLLALAALSGIVLARYVNLSAPPFEDAAMLMRYALHLADGHGVVWNVGADPVDGATDLVFMVLLSALVNVGITVEAAARVVGLGSHFATVALVYLFARRFHRTGPGVACLAAGWVAIGPGLRHAEAGFGTPLFAPLAATSWALAFLVRSRPGSWVLAGLFAASSLLMGVARPEGALLAVFMLLGIVSWLGVRASARVVTCFALVFGALGLVYLAWRWRYFGHPLPNPYYKKGDARLHVDGLRAAVETVFQLVPLFVPLYILSFKTKGALRAALFSLIPVVLFTSAWVLLSSETNFAGRFQYPIVPIVALSWPGLLRPLSQAWEANAPWSAIDRWGRALLIGPLVAAALWHQVSVLKQNPVPAEDGNLDVARVLADYDGKGYTIATTEAGLLPLYSRWRAVDTWGLNDEWISHHGIVTGEYLDLFSPELISFHAYFSPVAPHADRVGSLGHDWNDMTLQLRSYAESRNYALAASFGDVQDARYFYVRRDFPDAEQIVERIRGVRFMSYGQVALNLADVQDSTP